MRSFAIQVPEEMDISLGCQQDDELEALLKMLLAVKLFESGRTTSGQSALIAGVPRRTFLLELPKYGIPSVLGGDSEIEAEAGAIFS